MYAYCPDGIEEIPSNHRFGNRANYDEAKMWVIPSINPNALPLLKSANYMERVFIRPKLTNPEFDSITLESDNAKNSAYAKVGDKIKITVNLKEANTWKSSYNKLTFSIGSTTGLQTANYLGSTSLKVSGYRNYTILSGQNGNLSFTNFDFKNVDDLAITGFTPPYTPTSNIIVDITLPNISFTDDVSASLVSSDDITITVSDSNEDTASYKYGFSSDSTCDATDTYGESFTSGTAFTISGSTNNGKYICAKAEDLAGNISYQVSANPLFIDVTDPTATFAYSTT